MDVWHVVRIKRVLYVTLRISIFSKMANVNGSLFKIALFLIQMVNVTSARASTIWIRMETARKCLHITRIQIAKYSRTTQSVWYVMMDTT